MQRKINIRKTISTALVVSGVQIAAIAATLVYRYFEMSSGSGNSVNMLLLFIVLTVLLNCFFMLKYANLILLSDRNFDMLSETNRQLEKLNFTLRSQRHDFMNHLQVVYSLIEMGEFGDAKDYIDSVYSDIQKVNRVMKTSNPAINALLQAKTITSEKLDIETDISITTQLADMEIPSWEFCRILGNLIDNAVYALQEIRSERKLHIELSENMKMYGFRVSNNGPAIPQEVIERIFDSGFTTKGENGAGMGLAITKEILQQYGGSISVSSNEKLTEFSGWIPKRV